MSHPEICPICGQNWGKKKRKKADLPESIEEITTCVDCKFYERHNDNETDFGFCHRYPPSWEMADGKFIPKTVYNGNWCGEFKKR